MIRKHEADVSWKAGILAFAVHGVLFVAMVLSINWKAAHPPMNITEVELWDQLPNKSVSKPVKVKEPPKPIEPPKPEVPPKPIEPPKPVEPPKPEPKPEPEPPKVDIELEQKKKAAEQKKIAEEKKKVEIEKLKKEMREEEFRQEKAAEQANQKKLKDLQELMRDDKPAAAQQQASSVNPSVIGEFTEKIKAKIRGNVNKTLCGDGNPELRFDIGVLPTGELSGTPKLIKSSGNATCDEAVERAIMASEPFPLPEDTAAKAQFRNLKLKFKPNGE